MVDATMGDVENRLISRNGRNLHKLVYKEASQVIGFRYKP